MAVLGAEAIWALQRLEEWVRDTSAIHSLFVQECMWLREDGGEIPDMPIFINRDVRMDGGGPVIAACRFPRFG